MRTSTRLAVGGAALSFVALGAAPALAVCDPYSQSCVGSEDAGVLPIQTQTRNDGSGSGGSPTTGSPSAETPAAGSPAVLSPATLPFTGGELVLIAAVGSAAVGAGVVLAAAGRRRAAEA